MIEASKRGQMLEKIAATVGELPSSPAIVSAIMGITKDLNADLEQLGKVMATDQALTAKVLKLSNSSFYGRPRAVSSIREAILILGFYTLRSLAIASSTHSMFKSKGSMGIEKDLWDHSLATALACRMVGKEIKHPDVDEIFIVGLLHDIGKLVLSQKLPDGYPEVIKSVKKDGKSFIVAENELLGFNHADVGLVLLNKWSFPSPLIEGVYNHHNEEMLAADFETEPVAAVVNFANELAKAVGIGLGKPNNESLESHPFAKRHSYSEEMLKEKLTQLKEQFNEEKTLFEEG